MIGSKHIFCYLINRFNYEIKNINNIVLDNVELDGWVVVEFNGFNVVEAVETENIAVVLETMIGSN